MSLYLEEGEKKGSQWHSLSSPTRLTGELAGQLAEICIVANIVAETRFLLLTTSTAPTVPQPDYQ